MYFAAGGGHKEIVELLIAGGADVNAKGYRERTALHEAAANGKNEIVELLIAKGADVNAKDEDGWTPLHHPARYGKKEVAKLLIANGADVNVKDRKGKTPLDLANWQTKDLLRKHGGKNISIYEAVEKGNIQAVKDHLTAGTKVDAKDDDGVTLLQM
ncbi:MAG: ankyrin repeat domain-containing protein, partial [Gammaproteobacteria bacterium]|nr:ankyrin repeat domain-containing protein [Gammaproteobacteria bacterium]